MVADKEKSKELLLDAAKKLFAQKGYERTTVREIAKRADVNLSLVSYHFEGKEGLYKSVIAQFGKQRLEACSRMLDDPKTKDEFIFRLKMMLQEMFEVHLSEPELTSIVHQEIDDNLPIAKNVFEGTFLQCYKALVEYFEKAKNKKFIKKSVNAEVFAQILQGSAISIARKDGIRKRYFNHSLENKEFRDQIIDQIILILLNGALENE